MLLSNGRFLRCHSGVTVVMTDMCQARMVGIQTQTAEKQQKTVAKKAAAAAAWVGSVDQIVIQELQALFAPLKVGRMLIHVTCCNVLFILSLIWCRLTY